MSNLLSLCDDVDINTRSQALSHALRHSASAITAEEEKDEGETDASRRPLTGLASRHQCSLRSTKPSRYSANNNNAGSETKRRKYNQQTRTRLQEASKKDYQSRATRGGDDDDDGGER